MIIEQLISELQKYNPKARIAIRGILRYPFQHAPIKEVKQSDETNLTVYIDVENK